MLETYIVTSSPHGSVTWGKWICILLSLQAFYSIFNERQRNLVYGESYKLRFMKRKGFPASIRTSLLAFAFWSLACLSFFYPKFWEWRYSGVLFLGGMGTIMISSYIDARLFRDRTWR